MADTWFILKLLNVVIIFGLIIDLIGYSIAVILSLSCLVLVEIDCWGLIGDLWRAGQIYHRFWQFIRWLWFTTFFGQHLCQLGLFCFGFQWLSLWLINSFIWPFIFRKFMAWFIFHFFGVYRRIRLVRGSWWFHLHHQLLQFCHQLFDYLSLNSLSWCSLTELMKLYEKRPLNFGDNRNPKRQASHLF